MKFGIFYELQLPRPWGPDDERALVQDARSQVELADRLGLDYAWKYHGILGGTNFFSVSVGW